MLQSSLPHPELAALCAGGARALRCGRGACWAGGVGRRSRGRPGVLQKQQLLQLRGRFGASRRPEDERELGAASALPTPDPPPGGQQSRAVVSGPFQRPSCPRPASLLWTQLPRAHGRPRLTARSRGWEPLPAQQRTHRGQAGAQGAAWPGQLGSPAHPVSSWHAADAQTGRRPAAWAQGGGCEAPGCNLHIGRGSGLDRAVGNEVVAVQGTSGFAPTGPGPGTATTPVNQLESSKIIAVYLISTTLLGCLMSSAASDPTSATWLRRTWDMGGRDVWGRAGHPDPA